MNHVPIPSGFELDPAICPHRNLRRAGIQRSPVSPRRLYLMTCGDCGTTLSTRTLRDRRTDPAPEEPEEEGRRLAG